jgi:hypothetical protein
MEHAKCSRLCAFLFIHCTTCSFFAFQGWINLDRKSRVCFSLLLIFLGTQNECERSTLWNADPNPSAWSRWPGCLNELFQRTHIALLGKDSPKYSSQESHSISNKHVSHEIIGATSTASLLPPSPPPGCLITSAKNLRTHIILIPLTQISRLQTQATIFLVPEQPA